MSKSEVLFKHSGGVHMANVLSLTERKILNFCLHNAYSQLDKDFCRISLSDLLSALGWGEDSNSNNMIKEAFRNLHRTQIEWNIFVKDKCRIWGITSFLSSVEICKGVVTYEISKKVKDFFKNPNIYARLNMLVQKKFRSRHAIVLWEFLIEILSSNKANFFITPYVEVSALKKMLGIEHLKTYKSFGFFNAYVLKQAVEEINDVSDIIVSVLCKKESRKITEIAFQIEKKQCVTDVFRRLEDKTDDFIDIKKEFNLSDKVLDFLVKNYGLSDVKEAGEKLISIKKSGAEIINPFAYLSTLLKKTEEKKISKKRSSDMDILNDKKIFEYIKENKDIEEQLKTLRNIIGDALFASWICSLSFSFDKKNFLIKCPSLFFRDYIHKDLLHAIQKSFGQNIILYV